MIHKVGIINDVRPFLRKDPRAKFRKYHLIFYFVGDSQDIHINIIKYLKAVTVNDPAELDQHFQSHMSEDLVRHHPWV